MLGNLGNWASLLKQAAEMKTNMVRMQEELASKTYEAGAGAGMVKAVVNGRGELIDLKIEKAAANDVELLEDLIKGAVCSAWRKAQEGVQSELAKVTGNLKIPGIDQMLGGEA